MQRYVKTVKNFDNPTKCKYCNSRHIRKDGIRQNKSGITQLMKCRDCNRKFSARFGFRYRRYSRAVITACLHMHFSGMSTHKIAEHFETRGLKIDHSAIVRWIGRYGPVAAAYMDKQKPETGSDYRADELYVKVAGDLMYLFSSMDNDTRYWLASDLADRKEGHDATKLFKDTLEQTGKIPAKMITDGLNSYRVAAEEVMPLTEHVREIHITGPKKGKDNNNRMERLNGTIRDREKTYRGLKTKRTTEFCGLRVNYNHARKHRSLKRTPGEEAGIFIEGADKWRTMIQNGSRYLTQTGKRV